LDVVPCHSSAALMARALFRSCSVVETQPAETGQSSYGARHTPAKAAGLKSVPRAASPATPRPGEIRQGRLLLQVPHAKSKKMVKRTMCAK